MTVMTNTKQADQPTVEHVVSAKRANTLLRAMKLRLHAYKSEGRFICRIVDKAGKVVSISSRSTLEGAVTIAVGNIHDYDHGSVKI